MTARPTGTPPRRHHGIEIAASRLIAPRKREIASAIRATLRREGCPRARISVAVVDDATIAHLHARYLGIEGPTDVLSFDLGGADGEVDGEVVVCRDAARREARRRGIPFAEELLRYVIHGTLHLLGHLDDSPARAKIMHRIEDAVLRDVTGDRAVLGRRSRAEHARRSRQATAAGASRAPPARQRRRPVDAGKKRRREANKVGPSKTATGRAPAPRGRTTRRRGGSKGAAG